MNARTAGSVYCSNWHLHHNLAVARDVCAGRFTHAGSTVMVSGQPDWTRKNLRSLPAWWAECIEFNYTLDLAFAFHTLGETRYLDTSQRLRGPLSPARTPPFPLFTALAPRLPNS